MLKFGYVERHVIGGLTLKGRVDDLGLIWNEAWNWEKFFFESSPSNLLRLTQICLALERKFVESEDVILLTLNLNVLTLRENRLNVKWFCWAWLKSLLTLIVRPILFPEFCTILLSIVEDFDFRFYYFFYFSLSSWPPVFTFLWIGWLFSAYIQEI